MPPQRCCCCNRSVQYKSSRNASPDDKQKAQGLGLLKLHEAIKICHTGHITIHKCPPQDQLSSGQPAALDQLEPAFTGLAAHQQQQQPLQFSLSCQLSTWQKQGQAVTMRLWPQRLPCMQLQNSKAFWTSTQAVSVHNTLLFLAVVNRSTHAGVTPKLSTQLFCKRRLWRVLTSSLVTSQHSIH